MNLNHFTLLLIIGISSVMVEARPATRDEIQEWCGGSTRLNLRVTNMSMEQACAFYNFTTSRSPEQSAPPRAANSPIPAAGEAAAEPQSASEVVAADPNSPCRSPELSSHIPARSQNGIPPFTSNMGTTRDNQIVAAVRAGNIPDFLRSLQPVQMSSRSCMGSSSPITLCVMPDYLAVGDNSNYVHTPIGITAATQIAGEMGFYLPTTAMVDAIFAQAQDRVAPSTRTPNASMTTTAVFTEHSRFVQTQFNGQPGQLRAGHQKDVVMTNRSGGVPIYGWHRPSGSHIQPLYLGHQSDYSDYSHGIRMISQTAFIDGRAYPLSTLLSNPQCAQALSSEGAIGASVLQRYPAPLDQSGEQLLADEGVRTRTTY